MPPEKEGVESDFFKECSLSHESVEAVKIKKRYDRLKGELQEGGFAVPSKVDELVAKYFRPAPPSPPLSPDEEEAFVIGLLGDYLRFKVQQQQQYPQQHPQQHPQPQQNGDTPTPATQSSSGSGNPQQEEEIAELESALIGLMKRMHAMTNIMKVIVEGGGSNRRKKWKQQRRSLGRGREREKEEKENEHEHEKDQEKEKEGGSTDDIPIEDGSEPSRKAT